DALPRRQSLIVEAETLQLVEVDPGLGGCDVVDGSGGDWSGAAIDGAKEHLVLLAGMNRHLFFQRTEFPIEVGRGLGIEAHRRQSGGDALGRRFGALGGPAKAGCSAEQTVERYRCEG